MAASAPIAIVAGVGPGTGGEVAKIFAKKYPTVLLARKEESYGPVAAEIEAAGGKALGIATDMTNEAAIKDALAKAAKWANADGPVTIAAAVFNVGGVFKRAPFLELTEQDFSYGYRSGTTSGFMFAQAVLPGLLKHAGDQSADEKTRRPGPAPTLIFTGATASVKSSARFAAFAAPKFALRAMSQSLAREFGPQGVHVAHAVIDGIIDTPRTREWNIPGSLDSKIDAAAIAQSYWALHEQPRNAWTWEIDLRPSVETW